MPDYEYIPRPSAAIFHNYRPLFDEIYLIGGYGSSKTYSLVHETIRIALTHHGSVGVFTEPTYDMLRDVAWPAFEAILEAAGISYDYQKSHHDLLFTNGSKVLFRSRENPRHRLGTTLLYAACDELTLDRDDEAFRIILSRLRAHQKTWFMGAGTPEGHNWLYQRIGRPELRRELAPGLFGQHDEHRRWAVVHARTLENLEFLGPDYLDRLRAALPKEFWAAYLEGQFIPLVQGRLYTDFGPENIRALGYDPLLDLHWSHDFNVDPQCSVIAQRRGRELWVIDEIVAGRGARSTGVAQEFLRRYAQHQAAIHIYGDASGARDDTRAEKSDYDLIREVLRQRYPEERLHWRPNYQNPELKDSILALMNAILDAGGRRRLLVDRRCTATQGSLYQTERVEGTWEIRKDKGNEHLQDALRYLVFKLAPIRRPAGSLRPRFFS